MDKKKMTKRKKAYEEAYQNAKEAVEELYALTDEDNPFVTEFWRINQVLDPAYRHEMNRKS